MINLDGKLINRNDKEKFIQVVNYENINILLDNKRKIYRHYHENNIQYLELYTTIKNVYKMYCIKNHNIFKIYFIDDNYNLKMYYNGLVENIHTDVNKVFCNNIDDLICYRTNNGDIFILNSMIQKFETITNIPNSDIKRIHIFTKNDLYIEFYDNHKHMQKISLQYVNNIRYGIIGKIFVGNNFTISNVNTFVNNLHNIRMLKISDSEQNIRKLLLLESNNLYYINMFDDFIDTCHDVDASNVKNIGFYKSQPVIIDYDLNVYFYIDKKFTINNELFGYDFKLSDTNKYVAKNARKLTN